jgi:hypothetical protein
VLHVRVVSPAALAGQLTARLAAAPGVQNVEAVIRQGDPTRRAFTSCWPAGRGGLIGAVGLLTNSQILIAGPTPAAFLQSVRTAADLIDHLQRVMTRPRDPPRMAW